MQFPNTKSNIGYDRMFSVKFTMKIIAALYSNTRVYATRYTFAEYSKRSVIIREFRIPIHTFNVSD